MAFFVQNIVKGVFKRSKFRSVRAEDLNQAYPFVPNG